MSVITRQETRYEIDAARAERLRQVIARKLPPFEYKAGYPVTYMTNVYFKADPLEAHAQAQISPTSRARIRLREYSYRPENGNFLLLPYCYLEIYSHDHHLVTKRRLRLPKRLLSDFLDGKDILEEIVRETPDGNNEQTRLTYGEVQSFIKRHTIQPLSAVHYRRWVYQINEQKLRITFDDQLTSYTPETQLYRASQTLNPSEDQRFLRRLPKVIMEIKCQGPYPGWLDHSLQDFLPRNVSKFDRSRSVNEAG